MVTDTPQNKASAAIEDIFPLTGLQEGIYTEYKLHIESTGSTDSPPVYNEQFSCTVDGTLQPDHFQGAWNALAKRHPMLRTAFTEIPGKGPRQVVLKTRPLRFFSQNLTGCSDKEKICAERARSDRQAPFDLAREPLVRISLLQTASTKYRLIVTLHHLIFDAWCTPLLLEDLMALYAHAMGQANELHPPPRTQFGDVIRAQNDRRGGANTAFWRDYLAGVEGMSPLPYLNKNAPPGGYDRAARLIDPATMQALTQLSGKLSIPTTSILHALWGWVLARLQDRSEVLLSVVRANRPAEFPDIDRVIGMFISTVLLRVDIGEAKSIEALFGQVHEDLQKTAVWSAASLAEMLLAGNINAGHIDHTIIGRTALLSGEDTEQLSFPSVGLCLANFHFESWDHYDFQIGFSLGSEAYFEAKFRHGRFQPRDIAKLLEMLNSALQLAVATPNLDPNTAPIFPSAVLATATLKGPRAKSIVPLPSLLTNILAGNGTRTITVDAHSALSATALEKAVNATAVMLTHTHNIGEGDHVGILVEPGNDVLIGILAAWRIGASFVPIAPDWPAERAAFALTDSRVKCLLTPALRPEQTTYPCPQGAIRYNQENCTSSPPEPITPDIAYIIYTSGSTGRPKGVAVGMEALSNYCHHAVNVLGLQATDAALQVSSPAFDLGYTTLFPILLAGGTLHWTQQHILVDPFRVIETMATRQVTTLKCTPSYLRLLLSSPELHALSSLHHWRLLILGGEMFDRRDLGLLSLYCPWLQVVNHYGPTETTIGCAMMSLGQVKEVSKISGQYIGTPVANTSVHIRDRHGSPVPQGIEGELVVEGRAAARGYINGGTGGFTHTDKTTTYRTGDRARITEHGQLEYLGRSDDMIKIRGFRVNAGETEAALRQVPGVDDAVVVFDRQSATTEAQLLAFVQSAAAELQPADIKKQLSSRLLPAQIPAQLFFVHRLLIKENGKPDREAMLRSAINRSRETFSNIPPQTSTEQRLAAIWQRVLKVERIGRDDDFFALGGNSLRALQVAAEVRREFDSALTIQTFFEYPTLLDLARRIDTGPLQERSYTVLCRNQECASVLCLPPALGVASVYKELLDAMNLDLGVDGIDCPGLTDGSLAPSLENMVEQMLAVLPDQGMQYQVLLGWSFGATLAVEMARQLEEKGRIPSLLLFDGAPRQAETAQQPLFFEGLSALTNRRYWSQVITILRRTMSVAQFAHLESIAYNNKFLWNRYEARFHLHGDILAFLTQTSQASADKGIQKGLESLTRGSCTVITVSGDHYSMFHPQHRAHWLNSARTFMRKACH
nr:AMP-binding protein [uncultured Desulfobulbus sp.]